MKPAKLSNKTHPAPRGHLAKVALVSLLAVGGCAANGNFLVEETTRPETTVRVDAQWHSSDPSSKKVQELIEASKRESAENTGNGDSNPTVPSAPDRERVVADQRGSEHQMEEKSSPALDEPRSTKPPRPTSSDNMATARFVGSTNIFAIGRPGSAVATQPETVDQVSAAAEPETGDANDYALAEKSPVPDDAPASKVSESETPNRMPPPSPLRAETSRQPTPRTQLRVRLQGVIIDASEQSLAILKSPDGETQFVRLGQQVELPIDGETKLLEINVITNNAVRATLLSEERTVWIR